MTDPNSPKSKPREAYVRGLLRLGLLRQLRHRLAAAVGAHYPAAFLMLTRKSARRHARVRRVSDGIDIIRSDSHRAIRINRAHGVYVPLLVEQFDYFFSSATPSPIEIGGSTYDLLDFSRARDQSIDGFADFPIMCPSLTEPFVTTEQYLAFAKLESGHVAIDLGAYSALSSIAFSKKVGAEGLVVALEPDPANLAAAEINVGRNIAVNGLSNIKLMQAVMSDTSGTVMLSAEGSMGSAMASLVGSYRGPTVAVRAMTLADVVREYRLERIDFIKFDIEGSELATILSNGDLLTRFKPRLIIEPHFVDGSSTSAPIIAFLQSIGYVCEIIEQTGFLHLPLIRAAPRG